MSFRLGDIEIEKGYEVEYLMNIETLSSFSGVPISELEVQLGTDLILDEEQL